MSKHLRDIYLFRISHTSKQHCSSSKFNKVLATFLVPFAAPLCAQYLQEYSKINNRCCRVCRNSITHYFFVTIFWFACTMPTASVYVTVCSSSHMPPQQQYKADDDGQQSREVHVPVWTKELLKVQRSVDVCVLTNKIKSSVQYLLTAAKIFKYKPGFHITSLQYKCLKLPTIAAMITKTAIVNAHNMTVTERSQSPQQLFNALRQRNIMKQYDNFYIVCKLTSQPNLQFHGLTFSV